MRTPPPSLRDDLRFSNTTGILQKKTMRFIGVEVEQETSAPPPKKNPGSAPEYCPCKKKEKRDLGAVVTCCNPLPRTINQAEHPA